MSKKGQTSDNLDERIISILKNVADENLAKTYAYYSNQLNVAEDSADNKEEIMFLLKVTETLSGFIVQKYMAESGFYQSSEDELGLWEHE